jgi:hypothetical protein
MDFEEYWNKLIKEFEQEFSTEEGFPPFSEDIFEDVTFDNF